MSSLTNIFNFTSTTSNVTAYPQNLLNRSGYYRTLFEILFPGRAEIIPGFWQPKWDANGEVQQYVDPSARTLGTYTAL